MAHSRTWVRFPAPPQEKEKSLQQILIGTNNQGKIDEYKILLKGLFDPVSLNSYGISLNVEETGVTYEENAIIKLKYLIQKSSIPVITDDSGLEVISLNNEPGVFSARYAGKGSSDQENLNKLLKKMEGNTDRTARFVCCIAYGNPTNVDSPIIGYGTCKGLITESPKGKNGFGYDPVFYNEELSKTFGELEPNKKILLSHRSEAVKDLLTKLNI